MTRNVLSSLRRYRLAVAIAVVIALVAFFYIWTALTFSVGR
jgi:hypothetical protein